MSCNSVPFSELNNKIETQLQLIQNLEHKLSHLQDSNREDWRNVIKTYLTDIRKRIEDLGNKETTLENKNLKLKKKIYELQEEITELTVARRKLSSPIASKSHSHKPPLPTIIPIATYHQPPKAMIFTNLNPSSIQPQQPSSPVPIEKNINGSPDIFIHKNFIFESLKNAMADSTEIDKICNILGIKTLPEMVFPNSWLKISLPNSLEMKFEAISGLKPCIGVPGEDKKVQVQYAREWKDKAKNSKDVERLEFDYDWTYTTDYKGDYISLKERETDNDEEKKHKYDGLNIELNVRDRFNMDMLRDTSLPILWSCHCILYEDELSDNGMSQLLVRCRVMDGCFLVLLRYWLRVDNVIVRINDTRIFHEFGKGFILKHYQEKEAKWNKLKTKYSMTELMQFNDPNDFADKIDILHSVYHKIYL